MKFLDKEQRDQVGFSFVLDKLEITTPFGLEERKNIKPFKASEIDELTYELNNLEIIIKSMNSQIQKYNAVERILCKFKDIRNSIKRCSGDETLDEIELYEIKYFSILVTELKNAIDKLHLNIQEVHIHSLEGLVSILDPQGDRSIYFLCL